MFLIVNFVGEVRVLSEESPGRVSNLFGTTSTAH